MFQDQGSPSCPYNPQSTKPPRTVKKCIYAKCWNFETRTPFASLVPMEGKHISPQAVEPGYPPARPWQSHLGGLRLTVHIAVDGLLGPFRPWRSTCQNYCGFLSCARSPWATSRRWEAHWCWSVSAIQPHHSAQSWVQITCVRPSCSTTEVHSPVALLRQ